MHEWKITEAILDEVRQQALENGIERVNKIVLSIGNGTDLTADVIRNCFEIMTKNGEFADVELVIREREDEQGIIVESIEGEG